MPEAKKMAVGSDNSTNESPAKSKVSPVGRNALAQVTMLDGTVLDMYIDVSYILFTFFPYFISIFHKQF